MKTYVPKKDEVERQWWLIDADGRILGRLATKVANLLRGKNKPQYVDFMDTGDFVIVINAEKIRMTGDKMNSKEYVSHSGYPGGQKRLSPKQVMAKKPERIFEYAVKGMLPKNRLGRQLFKNLHVYIGDQHPHEAQNPKVLELK